MSDGYGQFPFSIPILISCITRIGILINVAGPFFGMQLITFYGQALLEGVGIQGDQVTLALAGINIGIPIGMALRMAILPRVGKRPMFC
jgi:hypothetical protein